MSNSNDDYDIFPNTNATNISERVIISAGISLAFVIAIVFTLHIYARLVLSRQARQQQREFDFQVSRLFRVDPPPRSTGLDPKVMATIPIFKFKNAGGADQGNVVECAVCLSAIETGEFVRSLPNCKHVFHAECIGRWLGGHLTCPVCRTEATPRPMPEPREPPAMGSFMGVMAPPFAVEEGTSDSAALSLVGKAGGSSFRLTSFTRMLSRDRSGIL
ncbi:hypothetical protein Droror1_Dr00003994 [Drosera rotundifolia]